MRLAALVADPREHPRHEGVDRVHEAEDVDVEHPAPVVEALRSDRRRADHAGVVAEHVDAAIALVATLGQRLDGCHVAHVDGLGARLGARGGEFRRHRLGGAGLDIGDHDAHALAGQRERDRAADTAASAGDERHPALELLHQTGVFAARSKASSNS